MPEANSTNKNCVNIANVDMIGDNSVAPVEQKQQIISEVENIASKNLEGGSDCHIQPVPNEREVHLHGHFKVNKQVMDLYQAETTKISIPVQQLTTHKILEWTDPKKLDAS